MPGAAAPFPEIAAIMRGRDKPDKPGHDEEI